MCGTVVHSTCQLYFYIIVPENPQKGNLAVKDADWHMTEDGCISCSYDIWNSLF
jgi:hypothetical protein